MSADLSTFIELEGTQKELKSMIMVIKEYCGNKHDASLENTKIGQKKKFDGKNDVLLDGLTKKAIDDFLAASKKIYVEANGPYGRYGRVDEAGLFEAIAEAAPKAKFKAKTNGFTTGQQDIFTGDLKRGKLYLTYSCLPDDWSDSDENSSTSDEDWLTEECIYDPIKKEYKREHSVEEFVHEMIKLLPLSEFKSAFGLSKAEISNEKYHDYIQECYFSYQFPKMSYIDFKFAFPDAEIEEKEFNQNVLKVIENNGLVSYEEYCK
ncbi:hypothetical protein [Butyrivibrio sp. WCD2001]|uniref:hypothetical protein n=1 Tax=Butyrivibrio sp. WCD2001 TaxID=1280681 RepID=UPI000403ADE7|nr:hypothetical protein [Butyrivibrio sp. WCD2001]